MGTFGGIAALGVVLLWAISGSAQDAGGDAGTADADPDAAVGAVDAGAAGCATSGDCARPEPYCHPELGQCVACLSDTNCSSSTGVCAEDRGVCVECASDAHCFGATPYCDLAQSQCVQCLTDANCGSQGIQCLDGACGACGDGICGPGEAIVTDPYGYGYGGYDGASVLCPEDCLATCPGTDLGDSLGNAVASGSLLDGDDRLIAPMCGGGGSPDVTFGWSAPTRGTYVIDTFGSDFDTLLYVIAGDDCSVPSFACSDNAFEAVSQLTLDADAGDRFVIVVDSWGGGGAFELNIHELSSYDGGGAACNPAECERLSSGEPPCCTPDGQCGGQLEWGCDVVGAPPPFDPGGGGDGGPVDPVLRDRCLSNALSGAQAICVEVAECACQHCARATEDCRVMPGCRELIQCMAASDCNGLECNVPELCQAEIGASGGVNGPGFRAASALQTCAEGRGCPLECPDEPIDAGSGRACTPQREESCRCDDERSGVRICKDDGSGYGPCVCVEPERDGGTDAGASPPFESDEGGGCSCRFVPREHGAAAMPWLIAALLLGGASRRRGSIRTDS